MPSLDKRLFYPQENFVVGPNTKPPALCVKNSPPFFEVLCKTLACLRGKVRCLRPTAVRKMFVHEVFPREESLYLAKMSRRKFRRDKNGCPKTFSGCSKKSSPRGDLTPSPFGGPPPLPQIRSNSSHNTRCFFSPPGRASAGKTRCL